MRTQRALFVLVLATFCMVAALLVIVLRQQPPVARESDSQETTNSMVATHPLFSVKPSQELRQGSFPSPRSQPTLNRAVRPGETVVVPPTPPPETQPEPPVLPPSKKEALQVATVTGGAQNSVGGATITGKVEWQGLAPRPKKINFNMDPHCAEMHPDTVFAEGVIVNDNKTLRNVFVYVKAGLERLTFEAPKTSVELDQRGCQYQPHVLGIMTRQPLKIVNDDNTLHNIHVLPRINQEFNIGQPNQGMERIRAFAKPEVMIPVKCDVHPWMRAYIGVLEHPFFSVTGDDGSFQIGGLPSGNYLLEAWHEVYGTRTQLVTAAQEETTEVTFTFGP